MKRENILMVILVITIISAYIWIHTSNVREVSGFNQIVVNDGGAYRLTITQGDVESLRVDQPTAKTEVINNTLYLKSNRNTHYYVTVKDLNSIELMGPVSGTVYLNNIKLNDLSIKANYADIQLANITAKKLIINLSGGILYESANQTINNLTIYKEGSIYKTYLNLVNSSIPYTDI
ncbi:MAG TPA: DUF2807 domain-containing protein [Methanobacterium sp.]|nr:DUF2807 domain-containing protein [Methanobacterium sp.]